MDRARARHLASVAEAAVLLTTARLAVAVVPFRLLSRVLGEPEIETVTLEGDPAAVGAATVRGAVLRAARRLPFATPCLSRAVAGQLMLRRRGSAASVVFGLARDEAGWRNHAWLEAGGRIVLGEDEQAGYARTIGYRGAPVRRRLAAR